MLKLTKRKIQESEALNLVEQIRFTPFIMGYTLKEWLNAEHIIVAENEDGQILGACLNYNISETCTKIAALFVLEEFRGNGIGKALFNESINDAINRQKNVYTISANPIVLNLMSQSEFIKFSSLLNFPKSCQKHQLMICFHTLQWLVNPYRIQEIVRKKSVYKLTEPFFYGLKLCPENGKITVD